MEALYGPRRVLRGRVGSCCDLHEIAYPHQVVDRRGEGEQPADPPHPTEFDLPQLPHCLQPAEDLFDPFALLLTNRVAGVPRVPAINGTRPPRRVLGHTGRDLQRPQILHELLRAGVFVAPHRHTLSDRALTDQGQLCLPFRRTGRRSEARIHNQAMSILHQHMSQ